MLSHAVMSTSDSVYITDMQDKIVFVNKAFCQTYGYQEGDILGKHRRVLSDAEALNGEGEAPLPGAFEDGVFYHRHKDGSEFPVSLSRSVIENENGKEIAVVNVARDITERKRVEEELRELNVNKDKFFSIISHDLKSPLTFILGFSELLVDEIETLTIEEIKTYAANINRSARNLSNLLENLLQWSELQRGRTEYRPETVELGEIVRSNINLLQGNAGEKSINLFCDVEKNIFVYADWNMINSVVQNLISNAIKFTHSGGEVKINSERREGFVEVSVSDTGIGLSQERIATLFHSDTPHTTLGTAGEKGTGLGLMLCKEFVEKNGGKIWVESATNKGTTFRFSVPGLS